MTGRARWQGVELTRVMDARARRRGRSQHDFVQDAGDADDGSGSGSADGSVRDLLA